MLLENGSMVDAIKSTERNYEFFDRITRLYLGLSIFVIFIHADNLTYYE